MTGFAIVRVTLIGPNLRSLRIRRGSETVFLLRLFAGLSKLRRERYDFLIDNDRTMRFSVEELFDPHEQLAELWWRTLLSIRCESSESTNST